MEVIPYPKYKREKKLSAKLSDKQVALIRKIYSAGNVSQRKLGEIFGVAHSTIYTIVNPEKHKLLLKKYYSEGKIKSETKEQKKRCVDRKYSLMGRELDRYHHYYLKYILKYYQRPEVKEKRRKCALKYYYNHKRSK